MGTTKDRERTPSPNAPIIWILTGLACFCLGTLLLCCGWSGYWGSEPSPASVRFYDTNLTNPDTNSLRNLAPDEVGGYRCWVEDDKEQAQIGFIYRGQYYVLRFRSSEVKLKNELDSYYAQSEKGTHHVGIESPPWLTVNVTQNGNVLSPFKVTDLRATPIPEGATFLHKVQ